MRLFKFLCAILCVLLIVPVPAKAQGTDYGCVRFYNIYSGNGVSLEDQFIYPVGQLNLNTGKVDQLHGSHLSPDYRYSAFDVHNLTDDTVQYDLFLTPLIPNTQPITLRENLTLPRNNDGTDVNFALDSPRFVWSPNSKWLLYHWTSTDLTEALLAIADTTGKERIYRRMQLDSGIKIAKVGWSPDSRYIYTLSQNYSKQDQGFIGATNIAIWSAPALELLRTFRLSDDYHRPTIDWSPDGNYLALEYITSSTDTEHLAVLNINGGTPQLLTRSLEWRSDAPLIIPNFGWTEDGRYLVFVDIEHEPAQIKAYDTHLGTTKVLYSANGNFDTRKYLINPKGYIALVEVKDDKVYASYIGVRTGEKVQLPYISNYSEYEIHSSNSPLHTHSSFFNWHADYEVLLLEGVDAISWASIGVDKQLSHQLKPVTNNAAKLVNVESAVSKNGKHILLASSEGLGTWLVNAETGESKKLGDFQAWSATFSPDNRAVAFFDMEGNLNIVEIESAPLQAINLADDMRHIVWSEDSQYIIAIGYPGTASIFSRSGKHFRDYDYTELEGDRLDELTDWIPCP